MFFSVAKEPDHRFQLHDKVGDWVLSHDAGWHQNSIGWFKGYRDADGCGNWAEISWQTDRIVIEHGRYRSFPMWWDQGMSRLTNLLGTGEQIWADRSVSIDQQGLDAQLVDIIGTTLLDKKLSLDQASDLICGNLVQKAQHLLDDYASLDKKLFLTGGIDTLVLYSLMRYLGVKVHLVDYEYIKYDRFLDLNLDDIRTQHWGYSQIHHWDQPVILISGACGDEFLFRGPATIALWAAWHGIDLSGTISKANGYHVGYFKKAKNKKIFDDQWQQQEIIHAQFPTEQDLVRQILDINANDHQHWHLGNTLTWTPFLDLELTKTVLNLDHESLMRQIIDAELNRLIVRKLYQPALVLLSDHKNYHGRAKLHLAGTI